MAKVASPQPVTAAGQRLSGGSVPLEINAPGRARRATEWQRECWDYQRVVGEIAYGHSQLAEAASRVRLYVAHRPNPSELPVEAIREPAEGEELPPPPPGAIEAAAALDRLARSDEGLPGLLRSYVLNHQVAGDMYLTGVAADPDDEESEEWAIRSVLELVVMPEKARDPFTGEERELYGIKTHTGAEPKALPIEAYVGRLWTKDPAYSAESTSPMRAVRDLCDELLILSRSVRGRARSYTNAGILAIPQGMRMAVPDVKKDADTQPQPEDFITDLGNKLMAPVLDESAPESVVPVIIEGPEALIKEIRHIALDRPMDALLAQTRAELITRIAQGLNFPPEVVTGMAQANHWSAWVINQALFDNHVEPIILSACAALMSAFIRPTILEAGVEPADARNLMLWYDASALVSQPDAVADIAEGHKAFVISDARYRSALNASDEDAPSPEEVDERIRIAVAVRGGPADEIADTTQGPPEPDGSAASAIVAAARRSTNDVGRRLTDIDRALRHRLEAAASAALHRALERAGARLRSRAQRDAATAAALADVGATMVAASLGPAIVAALDFDDSDLLAGAFDDFGESFDTWTARAQGRSRTIAADALDLDEAEDAEIAATQDTNRSEAGAWLATALTGLAATRLYNPSPAAPALGEHDPTLDVPPGTIREAMARAGGSGGTATVEGPAGGVATGTTLRDLFAQHGRVTAGWEWVYGDSERSFPAHLDLDGVSFDTWTDDVLAVRAEDDWLGIPYYQPGDHDGCQCDFVPVFDEASDAADDEAA